MKLANRDAAERYRLMQQLANLKCDQGDDDESSPEFQEQAVGK